MRGWDDAVASAQRASKASAETRAVEEAATQAIEEAPATQRIDDAPSARRANAETPRVNPRLVNLPSVDDGDGVHDGLTRTADRPVAVQSQGQARQRTSQGSKSYYAVPNIEPQRARATSGSSKSASRQAQMGYVPAAYTAHPKRKRHTFLKVLLGIFVVALVAVGGFWAWFSSQLDSALSLGSQSMKVNQVLDAPQAGRPYYVLVLGSDSREGTGTSMNETESGDNERSDVMMLVRVDQDNRLVTIVSIPRDTPYWINPDEGPVKINELYNMGGAAASIEAVSDLTGVKISHFAEVHFSELQQMVDAVGGVTVHVDTDLYYQDALTGQDVYIPAGTQTLTGQQAQIYARARHEYEGNQDAHRQENVRTLAMAIMRKVLDRPATEIPGTVLEVAKYVGTDIKSGDLVGMAASFVMPGANVKVYSGSGPNDGDINPATGLWTCYKNPQGWVKLMGVVDSGGDPSGLDFSATAEAW